MNDKNTKTSKAVDDAHSAVVTNAPKKQATVGAATGKGDKPREGRSFLIWTADSTGKKLQPKPAEEAAVRPNQDPSDSKARQIVFTPNPAGKQPPPNDQMELYAGFERVIHALNHLYPAGEPASEAKFRLLYHTVFGLAQLALEADEAHGGLGVDAAKKALEAVQKDIVDDEAPRVKNANIREQLRWALWISIPAVVAYMVLSHVPSDGYLSTWLTELGAQRATVANFMLLWVGCCLGVCLSYALRKPDFTLEDLVTPESDFLTPAIRIGLTGTLTMLLVMFSVLGIVDLAIASHKLSDVANPNEQMLAFVAGVICGIGEKFLSGTVMSKTKSLMGNIK